MMESLHEGTSHGSLLKASRLGIERKSLRAIECGENGCSIDLFIRMSEIYGGSLDYLPGLRIRQAALPLGQTQSRPLVYAHDGPASRSVLCPRSVASRFASGIWLNTMQCSP